MGIRWICRASAAHRLSASTLCGPWEIVPSFSFRFEFYLLFSINKNERMNVSVVCGQTPTRFGCVLLSRIKSKFQLHRMWIALCAARLPAALRECDRLWRCSVSCAMRSNKNQTISNLNFFSFAFAYLRSLCPASPASTTCLSFLLIWEKIKLDIWIMSATGELMYDKLHEQKQNVKYTSRLPPAFAMTLPSAYELFDLRAQSTVRAPRMSFNSQRWQNEAKIVLLSVMFADYVVRSNESLSSRQKRFFPFHSRCLFREHHQRFGQWFAFERDFSMI